MPLKKKKLIPRTPKTAIKSGFLDATGSVAIAPRFESMGELLGALASLIVGCAKMSPAPPAGGSTPATTAPSPSFSTASSAAAVALSSAQMQQTLALPACPCPGNAQALTHLPLEEGTRYAADVQKDEKSSEWLPTPFPTMPYHHASNIEWDGLERFPKLDGSLRLGFSGIATSEQIRKVPGEYLWKAMYRIKLECVCSHR